MLIYQPHLTDEQIEEVNSGIAPHSAYMRTLHLSGPAGDSWAKIADALPYYRHTANVEAETPDAVFQITNIGPESAIERIGPMRSGSVGDVILTSVFGQDKRGWACLSFGWLELTQDQINFFLTKVSTTIKMEPAV